jgi:hypothetical protein
MIASLTCQTGRDDRVAPIVPAPSALLRLSGWYVDPARARGPRRARTSGWDPRSPLTARHTGMAAQTDSSNETRTKSAKRTKTIRIANDRIRSGTSAIGS